MEFWKSAENQLEISYSSTMVIKPLLLGMIRLAGYHMKFWKSVENQLEIIWKSVGNQLESDILAPWS